jgi:hypothetical protein
MYSCTCVRRPHTSRDLTSYCIYVSSYYKICVRILLYMCPHTAIYVSAYCYICVLIPPTAGDLAATKKKNSVFAPHELRA